MFLYVKNLHLYLKIGVESSAFRQEARCSSVVRAFVHGAIGRLIDPSWWTH